MKLNTSLFICLFFSAIIAIKANGDDYEEYDEEYDDGENSENGVLSEGEEQQEAQNQADYQDEEEPQTYEFQYNPSQRLAEMEQNLPSSAQAVIPDGKVKETFTDMFTTAMNTDVAKTGLANVEHEWRLMLDGPEASRVIGTVGQNVNKIFTSVEGADMLNMLATTARVLLARSGEQKMCPGLATIVGLTYSLLTSDITPEVVNKAGGLTITAVNKPRAALFTKTLWDEIVKLVNEKNISEKLNKYFNNIVSMMKSMGGINNQNGRQLRRQRSYA
ncbi:uncharacterized protein LOC114119699 [Aphis gossypii]|uniref:uncharacterized protein LOC114119699 n=1 Tax=Aphis gossypii TaxID=80765 RepID=UPI002158D528|nr:uncharacterized protein LOC114119699 [Aphis gossypii]